MDLTFVLVPLAALIAPLLATVVGKVVVVPLVVFEIALGMLLGPAGLDWISNDEMLDVFSQLGLAMLFFMAGNEINPLVLKGRSGSRAMRGWLFSAVLALVAGFVLGATPEAAIIIAIALTGTALGTITPILRDSGLAGTKLGAVIAATGAVAEFAPLVAISVFLSGGQPLVGVITLAVFIGVAALAFWIAARGPRNWLRKMVTATLQTSGQFAIRFVVAVLAGLVFVAVALGVDFLLGAFAAGMLARVVLRGGDPDEYRIIEAKLDSLSFGFLVPIFFVATGVTFPLQALFADTNALMLVPVFAIVILLVRGLPTWFVLEKGTSFSDRRTAVLFAGTSLPLIIAATEIGTANGGLDESTAAAMVGGGLLTVMLYPLLALAGRKRVAESNTDAATVTASV